MCWQVKPESPLELPASFDPGTVNQVRLDLLEDSFILDLMDECYVGLSLTITVEEVSGIVPTEYIFSDDNN